MGQLDGFAPREVRRVLERRGWTHIRTTGSHQIDEHPDSPDLVSLPNHDPVRTGLLRGIIRKMWLSVNAFLEVARK